MLEVYENPELTGVKVRNGNPIYGVAVMHNKDNDHVFICTAKKAFWTHINKTFPAPTRSQERPFLQKVKQLLMDRYRHFYNSYIGSLEDIEFLRDNGMIQDDNFLCRIAGEITTQRILERYEQENEEYEQKQYENGQNSNSDNHSNNKQEQVV